MRNQWWVAVGVGLLVMAGASVEGSAAAAAVTCPTVDTGPDTLVPNGPDPGTVTPPATPRVNWSGCNLSQAFLTDASMAGANLAGANLTRADLSGANLTGANLAGAIIRGAQLSVANLTKANLTGVVFAGTYMAGAYVSGANLSGATVVCGPRQRVTVAVKLTGTPSHLPRGWTISGGRLTALRLPCAAPSPSPSAG